MAPTSIARGTTGPKQRLAIKGNVTGVVVTPALGPGRSRRRLERAPGHPGVIRMARAAASTPNPERTSGEPYSASIAGRSLSRSLSRHG
jgi:hypothetical protein